MLRLIGDKLFYAGHHIVQKDIPLEQDAETCRLLDSGPKLPTPNQLTGNLPRNRTPHFRFTILEKLDKRWNQVPADNFLIHGLGNLKI